MVNKDFYRVVLECFASVKGKANYDSLIELFRTDKKKGVESLEKFVDEYSELVIKELAIFEEEGSV